MAARAIPIGSNSSFADWFLSKLNDTNSDNLANQNRIPRVPRSLRSKDGYMKCFDPEMVSLGPYHNGNPSFKPMERFKFDAMKRYTNSSLNSYANAEQVYEKLKPVALEAKAWYEGQSSVSNEVFARMIYVDACFILDFIDEFIRKSKISPTQGRPLRPDNDGVSLRSHDTSIVLRDMMLLENQVPLFVLKELMSITKRSDTIGLQNIDGFINVLIDTPEYFSGESLEGQIQGSSNSKHGDRDIRESIHLLDIYRKRILGNEVTSPNSAETESWYSFRSVTELKEAGIKCKRIGSTHLRKVNFKSNHLSGELLLPHIVIDDMTKCLLVNMIAYELDPSGPLDRGITSYIWFMDSLVDREEDVKELRAKSILLNSLGSDKEVADLFNVLATDLTPDPDSYASVKRKIESHCKNSGRVYIANLLHTHFSTPWTTVGFSAAVLILILTMIQTFFAVFPRK
ncbi:hypothetical protein IFM89_034290 [Coptis chinensis]|uniref:Uncharacterized protein n=1 Tax=Coptis chinensis TaxID=261450 RepID=A0A835M801_9MAGN|nr:hypothetical protein IFM89_034290 [Coptis chinensis]